ncbi:MAG: hypothetical protein ABIJ00_12635 [Candidatus Eisenbacteria bacterium]
MRGVLLFVIVVAIAAGAYAFEATESRLPVEVDIAAPDVEFYCQPPHIYLQVYNANTAFGSEVVDDIPDGFVGMQILDIVFYVSEWGDYWIDPTGVYVNIYYSECAPGLVPDVVLYFPWGDLIKEVVYDSPGSYTCYRCKGLLDSPVAIVADMSLGFQVDNSWGQVVPYSGIVMTDDAITFGDCESYWDATYWGYPRWTAGSDYFGIARDVAYCLSDGAQGDPSMDYITCLSDCHETVYKFDITAGGYPVDDMEICVYDPDTWNPVPVEICSHPLDWDCGYNSGPHCIYYETTTHPLAPGETYGPFDFGILGVYDVLAVVWTFTYDGVVVAGPDTAYFICGASATEPSSWGAIKTLYR